MPKRPLFLFILAAAASGCGTDPHAKRDKLEITSSPVPIPFRAGDTSGLWTAAKTVIGTNGRSTEIDPYPSFRLVSSDSDGVGVADGRFVVARKPGSAEVTARDEKSDLASEASVTVTVTAP